MRFKDKRIMKVTITVFLASLVYLQTFAQIPEWRLTNWNTVGNSYEVPIDISVINILDFGAIVNDGLSDNMAINEAIESFEGGYGKIIMPAGTYNFTEPIVIPSGICIYGDGNNSTILKANLGGVSDFLVIQGGVTPESTNVTEATKGNNFITLDSTEHGYAAGDILKLSMDGTGYMFSDWAMSCMAQIIKIQSVNADTLFIESTLRHDFPLDKSPVVQKINVTKDILIAGLKIEREDASVGQTSNISFNYAYNCQIRAIESYNCNFAHISISNSTNIGVSGSYIHHAFAYGGGGQGYGTEISASSGECLIENNIFEHLRHSILMQSGANGNVAAYNYSFDPYWSEAYLPAASAGDLVFHGNYPYCNLFEGNIAQNAILDDSHDINGPFNTFFRNRLEKYGIVMNFNPPTDSSNFVGNEITNTGFLLGNFTIYGNGNFSHGNNVKGTCNPSSTQNIEMESLYLQSAPCYFYSEFTWPAIGYPSTLNANTIPAKQRYTQGIMTFDTCIIDYSAIQNEITEMKFYPNPCNGELFINDFNCVLKVEIIDQTGRIVFSDSDIHSNTISLDIKSGMYLFRVFYQEGKIVNNKIFVRAI